MWIKCIVTDNKTNVSSEGDIDWIQAQIDKHEIKTLGVERYANESRLIAQIVERYADITVIKNFYFKPEEWLNRDRLIDKFMNGELVIVMEKEGNNYVEV